METLTYKIKNIVCYTFIATLMLGAKVINAQEGLTPVNTDANQPKITVDANVTNTQEELAPDQNPNYRKSMDKYLATKDELVKTEGTTVQATYKAIDDMQIRQERRDMRRTYRQQRRLARINNGYYYYSPYSYGGYNSFGYGYNSYNSYPNYYGSHSYYGASCGLNAIASTALLGLGLYWWLR